ISMRGYVGDCACTCGGSGGQGGTALLNYDVTACLCLGRREPPAHPQGRGACPVTPRANRRGATRTSARSAFLAWLVPRTLNRIEPPCTDPYARWCGRGGAARLPPIPINLFFERACAP